jgi:hypothetical protein
MKFPTTTFMAFKAECSLQPEGDYFIDMTKYGCNETEFEKWLKSQRLFVKRFGQESVELDNVQLPINKWMFFTEHFERAMRTKFITSNYPKGWFEAKKEDGQVAAFLPEPDDKYKYRISYYRENGPTYHECYNSRTEALTHLANGNFIAEDGVLDALLHTDKWNRGIYVTKWLAEGIHPTQGVERERSNPEIQRLFADVLANKPPENKKPVSA